MCTRNLTEINDKRHVIEEHLMQLDENSKCKFRYSNINQDSRGGTGKSHTGRRQDGAVEEAPTGTQKVGNCTLGTIHKQRPTSAWCVNDWFSRRGTNHGALAPKLVSLCFSPSQSRKYAIVSFPRNHDRLVRSLRNLFLLARRRRSIACNLIFSPLMSCVAPQAFVTSVIVFHLSKHSSCVTRRKLSY